MVTLSNQYMKKYAKTPNQQPICMIVYIYLAMIAKKKSLKH